MAELQVIITRKHLLELSDDEIRFLKYAMGYIKSLPGGDNNYTEMAQEFFNVLPSLESK